MSSKCANCQSLFFKTLETRLSLQGLLYKKRCKRCKYKYLVRKDPCSGQVSPSSLDEWQAARKIHPDWLKEGTRGQIFISEYSRRISHACDQNLSYLNRISKAEQAATEEAPYGRPQKGIDSQAQKFSGSAG